MTDTDNKNSPLGNRWAILAIYAGFAVGIISAVICLKWQLIIFGFNIMYIVSPLLAGVVESYVALKKYGKSTGAISALLTFILINLYGWVLPGWIFPKEPATLSLITIIALVLTIQAAFPIFVNHILLVVLPGIFSKFMRVLVRTPAEIIQATSPDGEITNGQADELFLDELSMPLVSVPGVNGEKIKSYVGLVVGEAIAEENESEGRFSTLMKIIEPAQLDNYNLGDAKKEALSRMLKNAEYMGANGVVEVLIDFVSMGGLQGSATIVTATGTAVIFGKNDDLGEGTSEDSGTDKIGKHVIESSQKVSDSTKNVKKETKITVSKGSVSVKGGGRIIVSEGGGSVKGGNGIIVSEDGGSLKRDTGKIKENIHDKAIFDDFSSEISQYVNDEKNKLSRNLELATKTYLDEDLEKRFIKVSKDFDNLDNFEELDKVSKKRKKEKKHVIYVDKKLETP